MGLLVTSDQIHNSVGGPGKSLVKGDLFMIAGATLYGFSEFGYFSQSAALLMRPFSKRHRRILSAQCAFVPGAYTRD
jgi:hypothetical protein